MKKTITTTSGFKCSVKTEALDDMRVVELIAEMEENALALPRFLTLLLGDEQKEKLYKHIETKDGRVPMDPLQAEVAEIIEALGEDAKK